MDIKFVKTLRWMARGIVQAFLACVFVGIIVLMIMATMLGLDAIINLMI